MKRNEIKFINYKNLRMCLCYILHIWHKLFTYNILVYAWNAFENFAFILLSLLRCSKVAHERHYRKKNSVILTFAFMSHPVIFSTASLTSSKFSLKLLGCFSEVRDFEFSPSRTIKLNNDLIFAHYLCIVYNQRDFDEIQKFNSVLSK